MLETILQNLAKEIDFKVNFEDLVVNFDNINSDSDVENIIEDCRETFKEQFKNIERPNEQLSWVKPSTEQAIVHSESYSPPASQEPVLLSEPQTLVPHPTLEPAVQQQVAVHVPTVSITSDQTESALRPKPQEPMQPANPKEPTVIPSIEPFIEEQQEPALSPIEQNNQSSVIQQDPEQTEVVLLKSEDVTKTSPIPPKKKSTGQRLRKAILGY